VQRFRYRRFTTAPKRTDIQRSKLFGRVYMHVLKVGGMGVRSPLDALIHARPALAPAVRDALEQRT
jgi:hypothetical protein